MSQYTFVRMIVKLLGESRYICSCWIAHRKRSLGFKVKQAATRLPGVQNPCPGWAWNLVAIALLLYELRGRR